jgi:hypothetical protein
MVASARLYGLVSGPCLKLVPPNQLEIKFEREFPLVRFNGVQRFGCYGISDRGSHGDGVEWCRCVLFCAVTVFVLRTFWVKIPLKFTNAKRLKDTSIFFKSKIA